MNDDYLPDADYCRIVETLKNRESALSGGNLAPRNQSETSNLIRALNPNFNPKGSNVAFINSLKKKLSDV